MKIMRTIDKPTAKDTIREKGFIHFPLDFIQAQILAGYPPLNDLRQSPFLSFGLTQTPKNQNVTWGVNGFWAPLSR